MLLETGASASTAVIANCSSPAGVSSRSQASSSAGCGSIPGHSGPRWSIAARSRAPNASFGSWPSAAQRAFGWGDHGAPPRSAAIRAAVVGSCSRAAPIWTATAPASRKARTSSADAAPPAPTSVRSGRAERTSATQRSATGRIAGPLRPAGTAVGHQCGQRVAEDHRVRAGPGDRAGGLDDPDRVVAELGQHRDAAGQVAADRLDRAGRLERLPGVEHAQAAGPPAAPG